MTIQPIPLQRHPRNPILTRADIPDLPPDLVDITSVFNPGAVPWQGRTVLMLRVQNRGRETFGLIARSADGLRFDVERAPVRIAGLERVPERIYHVYDHRLTRIGDEVFTVFAMDVDGGCRLGIARTKDFLRFDMIGLTDRHDNRNGVLFPERVGGHYLMLDRPNRAPIGQVHSGSEIRLRASDDLHTWQTVGPVAEGRWHYWDELIGAGPPPLKTRAGWLLIYHGIAKHYQPIYQAGAMLLDLEHPERVVSRGRFNILEPREPWELSGQVPNVVFPTGLIAADTDAEGFARPDSPVRLYYGAADTCIGLAETTVANLLAHAAAGAGRDPGLC